MKDSTILIIDDDQNYCDMIVEFLTPEFTCLTSHSAEGIVDVVKTHQPKVVLIDLNLPDMSGFELCEKLKPMQSNQLFSMFIVSGSDDMETKLRAFEVGADDFIGKPFELKELRLRILRTIEFVESRQDLSEQEKNSRNLAEISMKQASQYSFVMNFFKSLGRCTNQEQVANLFFDAMEFFGLHGSIVFRVPTECYFSQSHDDVSPIEKNIYGLLKNMGRLYEFGHRLMVNDDNVSFLVKNLSPDPEKAGQARDFLAALIEGIEAKIKDINIQSNIDTAIDELKLNIKNIKLGITENNHIVSSVMSDMVIEISASYHSLDMSEEQEDFFTKLIENGRQKLTLAERLLDETKENLKHLMHELEKIQTKQNSNEQPRQNEIIDIELF